MAVAKLAVNKSQEWRKSRYRMWWVDGPAPLQDRVSSVLVASVDRTRAGELTSQ